MVRRPLPSDLQNPKLQTIVVDFGRLDNRPEIFQASHLCCALGTTIKQAGPEVTLAGLAARDDARLERTLVAAPAMNTHLAWFHVVQYEVNHRGQIRWLRARLGLFGRTQLKHGCVRLRSDTFDPRDA